MFFKNSKYRILEVTALPTMPLPNRAYQFLAHFQNGEMVGQALSLKTDTDVKHMKICCTISNDGNDSNSLSYYL